MIDPGRWEDPKFIPRVRFREAPVDHIMPLWLPLTETIAATGVQLVLICIHARGPPIVNRWWIARLQAGQFFADPLTLATNDRAGRGNQLLVVVFQRRGLLQIRFRGTRGLWNKCCAFCQQLLFAAAQRSRRRLEVWGKKCRNCWRPSLAWPPREKQRKSRATV